MDDVGFVGGRREGWTMEEIDQLKFDWLGYIQKHITSTQLREKYKGRTILAIGKKYHKVFGRVEGLKKKESTIFKETGLFENADKKD